MGRVYSRARRQRQYTLDVDITYDAMREPWKLPLTAVLVCLTLTLVLSAFFRSSNLFGLDRWMSQATRDGSWKTYALIGGSILAASLLIRLVWRKP